MARFSHLFIVTYGRSGSTLLQGMLNTLPGYLIRGENLDLLGHAYQFFQNLPRSPEWEAGSPRSTSPSNAWYGCEFLTTGTYRTALAQFVETILLADQNPADIRCLGFKEIRYPPEQIPARLKFLQSLFPRACFVFNSRAAADVVASQATVGFTDRLTPATIATLDTIFQNYASTTDNCHHVFYEDVTSLQGSFRNLFAFLGEAFDEPTLRRQLGERHSYHRVMPGAMFSDFPAYITLNRSVPGIDFFTIDKLARTGATCTIGGVLVPASPHTPRIASIAIAGRYPARNTRIQTSLPSPLIAEQLARPDAAACRFSLSFDLPGPTFCQLRLDTGATLAVLDNLHALPP